jgi:predicted AAA+ superfamily ATPase
MLATLQGEPLHYWRDKAGHEVDFILKRRGQPPVAIECKWSAADVSIESLRAFRRQYPDGENVMVVQDADRPVTRTLGGIRVSVEPLTRLIQRLRSKPGRRAR